MLGLDLTQLTLDRETLEKLGESVIQFKNLEKFLIKSAEDKILPGWLGDLKNLEELFINESYLTAVPEWLKDFKKLGYLNLAGNAIRNLPEWLPTLPELKKLILWYRSKWGSRIFSASSTLELNQENLNILKALHDKNVGILDSIYSMHFELGLPFEQMKIIRELRNADGHNVVRGEKIKAVDEPRTSSPPSNIHLRVLDGKIAQMSIIDSKIKEIPESFGNIEGLNKLILRGLSLESLPESIGNLKDLNELDLSNNQLTSLPESFVNLTLLTNLDLSNNKFSEIPTELWALTELTQLNLNNNPLSSEENTIIQKVPDLIRDYLRKKATIKVFISHAVVDFEPYRIGDLVDYLEKQKEISEVYFCEADLAGNIDEWMLDTVQKCQLILFIGTNKSVFNSVDCENELQLADKFSIPVIPIKGYDVDWPDLAERNLSRELGMEFDKDNFDAFCEDLYKYIENFKREIDLMDKDARQKGIMDIYERFRFGALRYNPSKIFLYQAIS